MTPPAETTQLPLAWRLLAWPIGLLGWLIVRGLAATWRLRIAVGAEHAQALLREDGPFLLFAWHAGLYPIATWVLSPPVRRRLAPTLLVSLSRDGELVARALQFWGARVVRGSSSRGGREALRTLHRAMRKEGVSVLAMPDGPRGPERVFKPGTFVLAQVAGAPVVPLACRVSSAWRLRSWDRLLVPKPFARVDLAVGEPIPLPRELDAEEQAERLRELEGRLDELESELSRR